MFVSAFVPLTFIAHPFEGCRHDAYFMDNLRAWSEITNQLYIWHYNTNFHHYLAPCPDFDELAADIPMYQRHGVVGIFLVFDGPNDPEIGYDGQNALKLFFDGNGNLKSLAPVFSGG